ncbi:MAG: energy transducer TonB [Leptospirales bacterium]|nr:energy transducer TonB [Leptospirales bacterium]
MTLRVALILSFALHSVFFLSLWKTQTPDISARQGFAIMIDMGRPTAEATVTDHDSMRDPSNPDKDKDLHQEKNEKRTQRSAGRAGILTGSISDLQRSIQYPAEAEAMQIEGIVRVEVEIDSKGSVAHLRIMQSSGYEILDQAVLDGVRVWTFQDVSNRKIVIPFRFRLR